MKNFISNSAFGDIESIKEYYESEGISHVGKQYVVSIIEHIQTLSDNPDIGRKVPEFDEEKIRELIHSAFRIVYLRKKNQFILLEYGVVRDCLCYQKMKYKSGKG